MSLRKINLRDFFWLVIVVALCVAWWADRQQYHRRYERANNGWWNALAENASIREELGDVRSKLKGQTLSGGTRPIDRIPLDFDNEAVIRQDFTICQPVVANE
jgi:hypothetical protein